MRRGRGRPKSQNPLVFKSVGLTAEQWSWMDLWFPGGSPTAQLQAVMERALKFWPGGPHVFRKSVDDPGDTIDSSGWVQGRMAYMKKRSQRQGPA